MQGTIVHSLHGFLGLASDWDRFKGFRGYNLYRKILPYSDWARMFNSCFQEPGVLLGYSLGGRLAMHALLEKPELWRGAVIVSAHPGLSSQKERANRLAADAVWADHFLKDPWDLALQNWNNQAVFSGTSRLGNAEGEYSRRELAETLLTWSLGKQENLSELLRKSKVPILWIAGERDKKFVSLAIKSSHKKSKIWIAPDAGHRVICDVPKVFYQQVCQFCKEIS